MMKPADLIDYVGTLTLAGGDHDGKPFTVLPWEKRFLRGAFRAVHDSALSIARGGGKSALCAAIATAVVDPRGPLTGPRREVVVVASSFEQARIIFEDVIWFLQLAGYDLERRSVWRKQDSSNRAHLEYVATGARIRAVGSDPRRAHGLRSNIILCDEPAQWPSNTSNKMLAALKTGAGKVPGSRLIALGTMPSDEGHWFSRMIRSPKGYAQVHAARPDDPPFTLRTIRRANPSLDHLPSLKQRILAERDQAREDDDPDSLASYRALRLNMGTSDIERAVLLDAQAWTRAEGLPETDRTDGYVLGVDMGSSAAMSAAAAYWPSGTLEAFAVFPEHPDLRKRGLRDGVGARYVLMEQRGELVIAGARVSDIPSLLTTALARWGQPVAIVCDRWREQELRQSLDQVRFPRTPVIVRGQGFRDGGQDVRDFRAAVLGGYVRPVESLLLRSAMSEARVAVDPAGNSKLAKGTEGGRRFRARDDAAAATILAVAVGHRQWHAGKRKRRGAYIGLI